MSDNSVLRKLLHAVTVRSLSKYDSKETGWHSETSKPTEFKVAGVVVGSIPSKVETWTWLDDPAQNLSVEITQFDVQGKRISFGLGVKTDIGVWAWGQIPNVVTAEVGGSAHAHLVMSGSTQIKGNGLSQTEINGFDVNVSELRFTNDVLNALSDLVQESLNRGWLLDKGALTGELEAAIDAITFY